MKTQSLLMELYKNPTAELVYSVLTLDERFSDEIHEFSANVRNKVHDRVIHLRGIIEISNYCIHNCSYCGIGRECSGVNRYRMSEGEIIENAVYANALGYKTVVLQSGEDSYFSAETLGRIVQNIKKKADVAVTLSCGEYSLDEYRFLHQSGCDRYLLRFETSSEEIYSKMHEGQKFQERIQSLHSIYESGIQTGSGFLIGITPDLVSLTDDIMLCRSLDLDMIGCGPLIADPATSMKDFIFPFEKEIAFRTMAIMRIICPWAHIPATTAFDAFSPQGRVKVLDSAANVFMPNVTPLKFKLNYNLYPKKTSVDESAELSFESSKKLIESRGFITGQGYGHSIRKGYFQS
ncbi:MAG: [FeFe] hydrogenase H-cluster radical SAM maturase HydE [Deltaproteobacteria bacterium]|nr:[FeFe] hydrogenase H-cluster radical SAM maturase HydE [Deltaproteobacteria bacterium]